jgi:hypothetical protein
MGYGSNFRAIFKLMSKANTIILRPIKSTALLMLLACTAFVATGVWLSTVKGGWIPYLCIGFFGLGIPIALIELLPNSTYLRISPEELTFANMFRETKIPWNLVDSFFVVTMRQSGMKVHCMVGFNYVPGYDRARLGRRLSSALAQCEGALPDTYGKSADELADLLNRCLQEFAPNRRDAPSAENL